jgi:endogenous inhibitor of DNA gyrase (YacG/DUF329 family)
MIEGRCPICSKIYKIGTVAELKSFPFCSERCRIIDLGRWIDGKYAIPEGPAKQTSEIEGATATDVADEDE